MILDIMPNDV